MLSFRDKNVSFEDQNSAYYYTCILEIVKLVCIKNMAVMLCILGIFEFFVQNNPRWLGGVYL